MRPVLRFGRFTLWTTLDGLLWQRWHSVLRSHLTSKIYTLGRNSITTSDISHRFEIENITDYLGRVIQLSVIVLSFSQVLKLNICYALKQYAEIFAAFRSISHRILEKKT